MLDKVFINVRSGDGGNGAVTFHREKFVPRGGPDGGDGGKGGDVIIQADLNLSHLSNFRYRRQFAAENGGKGRGNNRTGKNGADLILTVPVGTVVIEKGLSFYSFSISDLSQPGQGVVAAKGGKGGRGNAHFVSSTNQVPRLAEKGVPGEEKEITLEMRLIADAGIIGYPNVGKSSLLAAASAAHPKIADYPFTTLEPMLGFVETKHTGFVLAEIPGLIAGAHQGKGLGHDFLRHIFRTRVLVHLIDGSSESPVADMLAVNNELFLFDPELAKKPQVLAVNKIDKPEVAERTTEIRRLFRDAGVNASFISAGTGEGVKELMEKIAETLVKTPLPELVPETTVPPIIRPRPQPGEVSVSKMGGVYLVSGAELDRLVAGSNTSDPEVRRQLGAILTGSRIRPKLIRLGIQAGDKVRVGDFEWEW